MIYADNAATTKMSRAAIDAMKFQEMVGSIAGDDTIICIIRDDEEAVKIMKKLRKIVGK